MKCKGDRHVQQLTEWTLVGSRLKEEAQETIGNQTKLKKSIYKKKNLVEIKHVFFGS